MAAARQLVGHACTCLSANMVGLAFEHINLRFNPFGELDAEIRAQVAILPPLTLPPGHVLQLMGDAGRGKTTLLLAWHHAASGSAYEYVPEGQDRLVDRTLPPLMFVDEAQRLCPRRQRLFDQVERLVLATHDDLSSFTTRPVETVVLEGIDVDRLERILSWRIEAARRGAGSLPRLSRQSVERLAERLGDDLRAMELHLYDVFQSLEAPCDVEV